MRGDALQVWFSSAAGFMASVACELIVQDRVQLADPTLVSWMELPLPDI